MQKTRNWLAVLTLAGFLGFQALPAFANIELTFTTAQAMGVYIATVSPANGSTGLGLLPTVHVTFASDSNMINFNTSNFLSNFKLFQGDGTQVSATVSAADFRNNDPYLGSYGGSNMGVTITPTAQLSTNAPYYVEITPISYSPYTYQQPNPELISGTMDPANSYNAQYYNSGTNTYRINFTTEPGFQMSGASIGGSSITSTNGGNIGTNISPINVQLKVLMTKALNPNSLNGNVLLYEGTSSGTPVTTGLSVGLDPADGTNKTLLVQPGTTLKYAQTYTLVLITGDNGIKSDLNAPLAP